MDWEYEASRVKEAAEAIRAGVYYLDKEEVYSAKADKIRSHSKWAIMSMEELSEFDLSIDKFRIENYEAEVLRQFKAELHFIFANTSMLLDLSGTDTKDDPEFFTQINFLHALANTVIYELRERVENYSIVPSAEAA